MSTGKPRNEEKASDAKQTGQDVCPECGSELVLMLACSDSDNCCSAFDLDDKRLTGRNSYASLVEQNAKLRAALEKIKQLDPSDTYSGFNEWGEAECFRKAQEVAEAALSTAPQKDGE